MSSIAGIPRPLLTVPETAAALSLGEGTIRAWIASRRLAIVRLGRAVRIERAEVERLIAAGRSPAEN